MRARTLRGDVTQAELALGWRAVPPLHADAAALDLAAAVLGAGRGSWLYRRLREPGIVDLGRPRTTTPHRARRVQRRARSSRRNGCRARSTASRQRSPGSALLGPARQDLERARALLRARWARRMESMEGRAAALAAAEALDGVRAARPGVRGARRGRPDAGARGGGKVLLPDAVAAVALPAARRGRRSHRGRARACLRGDRARSARPRPRLPSPPIGRREPSRERCAARGRRGPHSRSPVSTSWSGAKPGVPLVDARPLRAPPALRSAGAGRARRADHRGSAVRGAGTLDAARARLRLRAARRHARRRASPPIGSASVPRCWPTSGRGGGAPRSGLQRAAPRRGSVERSAASWWRKRSRWRTTCSAIRSSSLSRRRSASTATACRSGVCRNPAGHHGGARCGPGTAGADPASRPVVVAVGDVDPERPRSSWPGCSALRPRGAGAREPRAMGGRQRAGRAGDAAGRPRQGTDRARDGVPRPDAGATRTRGAAQVWAAVASGLGGRLFEALRDRRSLAYTVWRRRGRRAARARSLPISRPHPSGRTRRGTRC